MRQQADRDLGRHERDDQRERPGQHADPVTSLGAVRPRPGPRMDVHVSHIVTLPGPAPATQTAGRAGSEPILRDGSLDDAMSNRTQLRAQARRRGAGHHGARERIAAQGAARQRRQRLLLAGGSMLAVIAIVATFIGIKLAGQPGTTGPSNATADAAVASAVTSVPAATLNAGTRTGVTPVQPTAGHQPLLTSGGKPEVLYVGAEYCPFCAAERWALTVALSRFGTFSGLHFLHSTSNDAYPNTPTLTFYKSAYTSRYLTFAPVEMQTVNRAPLQQLTASQQAVFTKYDSPPYVPSQNKLTFPFVDLGNQAVVSGAQYSPAALSGLTWGQVAAAIKNPGSAIGREITGAANMITAELCKLTNGQPGGVCSSAGVKAAS
jgi:thiol-disulfide isomerase/thioredoxin